MNLSVSQSQQKTSSSGSIMNVGKQEIDEATKKEKKIQDTEKEIEKAKAELKEAEERHKNAEERHKNAKIEAKNDEKEVEETNAKLQEAKKSENKKMITFYENKIDDIVASIPKSQQNVKESQE